MKTVVLALSFASVSIAVATSAFAVSIDYYENNEITLPYQWDGEQPAQVLLIQDQPGWGFNSHPAILNSCGVPYDIINSSAIAGTDFYIYERIVTAGQQPTNYYLAIQSNSWKFEDFMSGGGCVSFETASYFGDANEAITWPGGFRSVNNLTGANAIAIDNADNCVLYGVTLDELQGWNYSAHGYHTGLPAGYVSYLRTLDAAINDSCMGYFEWGSGTAYVSNQPLEWAYGFGFSTTFPRNFDCCDCTPPIPPPDLYYGACCIGDQGECTVMTEGQCESANGQYMGDDSDCEPVNPCLPVPTVPRTWGSLKELFQ